MKKESKRPNLGRVLESLLESKLSDQTLSSTYKRDIKNRAINLITHLKQKGFYSRHAEHFTVIEARLYMDQFTTSGTYYNNVKRTLGVLFQYGVERGVLGFNPFKALRFKTQKEVKHEPFDPEQLVKLLQFIESTGRFVPLRICINLVYGSLLRPHQEVRLLRRSDFNEDFSQITIPGSRTKNSKVRTVPVDAETTSLLNKYGIARLSPSDNIWSKKVEPYNESYFNNLWRKLRELDKALSQEPKKNHSQLIMPGQSLYSFRHNGAIAFYNKYQSVAKLMALMDHSRYITTEKYLRGLGMTTQSHLEVPDKYEIAQKSKKRPW